MHSAQDAAPLCVHGPSTLLHMLCVWLCRSPSWRLLWTLCAPWPAARSVAAGGGDEACAMSGIFGPRLVAFVIFLVREGEGGGVAQPGRAGVSHTPHEPTCPTQSFNQQTIPVFPASRPPSRPLPLAAVPQVEIGAFRTYPEGYKPPDEGPSEYQTIPLSKIEDFGVHAKQVGGVRGVLAMSCLMCVVVGGGGMVWDTRSLGDACEGVRVMTGCVRPPCHPAAYLLKGTLFP